jgi:1-acyl-sn-glycerol-3-phosphate acyltransferase
MLLAAMVDGWWRKQFCGMLVGAEGAVWVSGWCWRMVWGLGLECEVDGPLPDAGGGMLAVVANHLSYLDILVMSATQPMVMVAKSEIRGWPLLGWITAQAGTVYVQRPDAPGGRTQTHSEVNALMAEAYRSGLPVLFFPEGTTTGGETVLPFRRGLFNSVVWDGVPVTTAALAYELGPGNAAATVAEDVCFVGDAEFAPHLFRAMGLRGLKVRVKFGGERVAGVDRFELAREARNRVVELYEGISGVRGIELGLDFPRALVGADAGENLFDGPVERGAAVYDEVGVGC